MGTSDKLEKQQELKKFIMDLKMNSNSDIIFPVVEGFAYTKGKLIDRKVIVPIGEDYYIEHDIDDALALVDRQIESLKQAKEKEFRSKNMKLHQLLENLNVPEVNEQGEPFMEIREVLEDAITNVPKKQNEIQMKLSEKGMDDFDLNLLQRIRQLELEEENGSGKHVRFCKENSKPKINKASNPSSILKKTESIGKDSKFAPVIQTKKSNTMALKVVEKQFSSDSDAYSSEEDSKVQMNVLHRSIQQEYLKKRQDFINRDILVVDSNDVE